MFPSSIAVKKTALATLKNEWPTAIIAAVILLAFFLVSINLFSFIGYIFSNTVAQVIVYIILCAGVIFIYLPLFFGVLRFYWSLAAETPLGISEIFYYFSNIGVYKRLINFIFRLFSKMVLKAFVLLIPSFIIDLVSKFSSVLFANSVVPLWVSNIWIFAVVLRVIAICCIVYIMSRYYLAPFIFIAGHNTDNAECIKKAYTISRVSMGNFITLILSLLGWILLSVFFAPLVFTLPYFCMCYIIHSRYAAVYYNSRQKSYTGGC